MKTRKHNTLPIRRSGRLLARSRNDANENHSYLSSDSSTVLTDIQNESDHATIDNSDSTNSIDNNIDNSISLKSTRNPRVSSAVEYLEVTRRAKNREASKKTRDKKKKTEKRTRDRLRELNDHLIPSVQQEIRDVNQDIFIIKTALELSQCSDLDEHDRKSKKIKLLETIPSESSNESSE